MHNELRQLSIKGKSSPRRRRYVKVIGWICFIYGISSIIGGFFQPLSFILGIPLTIIGFLILRKELRGVAAESVATIILILGLLFIVIGFVALPRNLSIFMSLVTWGILLIIAGLIIVRGSLISKEQVLGDWGRLIEGAEGKAEEIFKTTEDLVKKSGVSTIKMGRKKLSPGIIKGVLGEKRDFLVVKETNFRLKPYQILVNARDYGNNLDITWYLTYRLSFIRWLLSITPSRFLTVRVIF